MFSHLCLFTFILHMLFLGFARVSSLTILQQCSMCFYHRNISSISPVSEPELRVWRLRGRWCNFFAFWSYKGTWLTHSLYLMRTFITYDWLFRIMSACVASYVWSTWQGMNTMKSWFKPSCWLNVWHTLLDLIALNGKDAISNYSTNNAAVNTITIKNVSW